MLILCAHHVTQCDRNVDEEAINTARGSREGPGGQVEQVRQVARCLLAEGMARMGPRGVGGLAGCSESPARGAGREVAGDRRPWDSVLHRPPG